MNPRRSRDNADQTDAWGITGGYKDGFGAWRETTPETRSAILAAMVADEAALPNDEPPVIVIRQGRRKRLDAPAELKLEPGGTMKVGRTLPADVPLGYHRLRHADGRVVRLIVCPPQCHLPPDLRAWGWSLQLYALRSAESWGIGDLADLRRFARWSNQELGAGLVQINPLCAVTPLLPQQASPYYPSSRCFRNPLYIRIEDVPGARDLAPELEPLAAEARSLNKQRRIDRDRVFGLKITALRQLHAHASDSAAYRRFLEEQGTLLQQFATFCALAEVHGGNWRQWPAECREANSPGVARFAEKHPREVDFHAWLQWMLDEQFRLAAAEIPIVQDLPIGFDPGGADAWIWQDALAGKAHVGAPPDQFNARGQDWQLQPFVPHRLRAAAYEPFIRTIRASLRHGRGLRIDHVMGLFRLFWIPSGAAPQNGCYVRYPAEDLLGILALESERAGAVVIGEDLGTVEPGVRRQMAVHQMLSYRVLWFESSPPEKYPELSLASVTTHDLPTVAGVWKKTDFEAQQRLGLAPAEEGFRTMRRRLQRLSGARKGSGLDDIIAAVHSRLAGAPSRLVLATLEDALAVEERPNMPGTVDEWPNWSIALPQPLDEIESNTFVRRVAAAMQRIPRDDISAEISGKTGTPEG